MGTDLLLVIDIGNSGAKLGVVRGEDVAGPVRLPKCDGPAVREFAKPLVRDQKPLVAVCGSDSARAKDLAWELGKVGFPGAIVVSHDHAGLPKSGAKQPEQAGVDRRVQALAAATLVFSRVVPVAFLTSVRRFSASQVRVLFVVGETGSGPLVMFPSKSYDGTDARDGNDVYWLRAFAV